MLVVRFLHRALPHAIAFALSGLSENKPNFHYIFFSLKIKKKLKN